MSDLLDRILADGEAALRDSVLGQEEALHLEFKTFADMSGTAVVRDDRKLLARAICGMSNAEGGLVIVGVHTCKRDGIDLAASLRPFANRVTIKNRVVGMLPDLLSPQHVGIAVHTIPTDDGGPGGYLIINIPPSDLRPHMSIPEHRYFRRGSDGTRVMEHGEVRDAMMAPREGRLEFFMRAHHGPSSNMKYGASLVFGVKNVGRVPVKAPYMRFEGSKDYLKPTSSEFAARHRNGLIVGYYAAPTYVVHIDDEAIIADFKTGLQLHATDEISPAAFLDHINRVRDPNLFSIRPFDDMYHNERDRVARNFKSTITFGAENAAMQTKIVDLDRWGMLGLLEPLAREAIAGAGAAPLSPR
jgi:hypothetical protein